MRNHPTLYLILLLSITALASCKIDGESYDYYTETFEFYGEYNGAIGDGGEYNYYICLSDFGFDDQGYIRAGATYYYFDIFADAPAQDGDEITLPEGRYTLGAPDATAMGTFTPDFSIFVGEDRYGVPIEQTFTDGTVTVTATGDGNCEITAELTDLSGMTHYVRYIGSTSMPDHSGTPDNSFGSLETDLEGIDFTLVTATTDGLSDPEENISRVILFLSDMSLNSANELMPPGTTLTIESYMQLNDKDRQIPSGTYTVLPTPEWGSNMTISSGEVLSGSLVGTIVEHYSDSSEISLGLITAGTMTVDATSFPDYILTFDFSTSSGNKVTGRYIGPLTVQHAGNPAASSLSSTGRRLHRPVKSITHYAPYALFPQL